MREAPEQAKAHLNRIRLDTYVGMMFSNAVAFFIGWAGGRSHRAGQEHRY